MRQLAGIMLAVFVIWSFLTLSQTEVLAWSINYPGGSVQWGSGRGAVKFPGGRVRWGDQGSVQFPGGRVDWGDRRGLGINVPGFNLNIDW